MPDKLLHPPFLGVRLSLYCPNAVAARVLDARGDVIALRLQHVGQVDLYDAW